MKNYIEHLLTSTKVATGTAATTVATSATASWLGWIPDVLGILATFGGLILSIVLIYIHVNKNQRESEEWHLKEQILKEKLKQARRNNKDS